MLGLHTCVAPVQDIYEYPCTLVLLLSSSPRVRMQIQTVCVCIQRPPIEPRAYCLITQPAVLKISYPSQFCMPRSLHVEIDVIKIIVWQTRCGACYTTAV